MQNLQSQGPEFEFQPTAKYVAGILHRERSLHNIFLPGAWVILCGMSGTFGMPKFGVNRVQILQQSGRWWVVVKTVTRLLVQ